MIQPDKQLQALRNRYTGRIWIVGNGPSLKTQTDLLPELEHEKTWVVNSFFRDSPNFIPTFYAANYVVWRDRRIHPVPEADWVTSGLRFFLNSGEHVNTPGWIQVLKRNATREDGVAGVGEQQLETIPSSATSPYVMAQLAGWMGFTTIYFIGCEQTDGYFYDADENRDTPYFLDRFNGDRWRKLKKIYTDLGREVWDCSPDGNLNGILGYIPLEEALDLT